MRGITRFLDTDRNPHSCDQALQFPELWDPNYWKIPSEKVGEYSRWISRPKLEGVFRSWVEKQLITSVAGLGLNPPAGVGNVVLPAKTGHFI
jgi:hypothetical protein